ncbi:hypothetical protein EV175_004143 [Coemansia sp. RSA 1933]|nr:hypothetical protein EV175_004143 [Coemansia sp. RSA 1933]
MTRANITDQVNNETAQSFIMGKTSEDAPMTCFFRLCEVMSSRAAAAKAASDSPNKANPQERYTHKDHQHTPIPNSTHKPDGVFYYPRHKDMDISAVHMCAEAKFDFTLGKLPDLTKGQDLNYMNAL